MSDEILVPASLEIFATIQKVASWSNADATAAIVQKAAEMALRTPAVEPHAQPYAFQMILEAAYNKMGGHTARESIWALICKIRKNEPVAIVITK